MIDDEEQTPVIFIILDDEHFKQICSNINEVKGRGATVIVISNCKEKLADSINIEIIDNLIEIPDSGVFSALIALVPLLQIAYFLALEKGINPDSELFDQIERKEKFPKLF